MASSVMIKSRGREFDNSSTAAPFAVSPQHPSPALSLSSTVCYHRARMRRCRSHNAHTERRPIQWQIAGSSHHEPRVHALRQPHGAHVRLELALAALGAAPQRHAHHHGPARRRGVAVSGPRGGRASNAGRSDSRPTCAAMCARKTGDCVREEGGRREGGHGGTRPPSWRRLEKCEEDGWREREARGGGMREGIARRARQAAAG